MLIFLEGGKPENPEKNPRSKARTNNKLNLQIRHRARIKPGSHWLEARAPTSAPSVHPNTIICVDELRNDFFSCVSSVMGLICYQCKSTVSWERCRTTTKTCHPSNDRCAKVHYKVGDVDYFHKDCIPKAECVKKANRLCKGAVECDVNCCVGNDCNAGPLFLISGILFLTCAVISLVSLTET